MNREIQLKVRRSWDTTEEIWDLARAQHSLFVFGPKMMVLVEGRSVTTYDELIKLINEDEFKDRQLFEVVILPHIPLGG